MKLLIPMRDIDSIDNRFKCNLLFRNGKVK